MLRYGFIAAGNIIRAMHRGHLHWQALHCRGRRRQSRVRGFCRFI